MADNTVPLFDTHCHSGLVLDEQEPVRPGVHELIASVEIGHWDVIPQMLSAEHFRLGALGLHPWYASQWKASSAERLEALLANPDIIAIGEVGLEPESKVEMKVQEHVLRAQIRMALKTDKPLILHVSKGYNDILRILQEEDVQRVGGVVHGFSAGANIGNAFIRLGFYLGIGPVLLRKNARKLPEALSSLPPERLVLETDAQGGMEGYRAPEQRAVALGSIVNKLADIYAISAEQMRSQVWGNSCKLFRLDSTLCGDV